MTATPAQIAAAKAILFAVRDAIRDVKEVPAGHLYAMLMGTLSLADFEAIIRILVASGQVRRSGSHLLTWIGPEGPVQPATGGRE